LHKKKFSGKPSVFETKIVKSVKVVTPRTHCPADHQYYPSALIFRKSFNFNSSCNKSLGNFVNWGSQWLGFPTHNALS